MGYVKFHVRVFDPVNWVYTDIPVVGAKVQAFQVGGPPSVASTFYTDQNGDVGGVGSTDDPNAPPGVTVNSKCDYYAVSAEGYMSVDANLIGTNWVYMVSSVFQPSHALPDNEWVEVAYCYRVDAHTFKLGTRLKVQQWRGNTVQLEILVSDHAGHEEGFFIQYTGQLVEYTCSLQYINLDNVNVGVYVYLVKDTYNGWILANVEAPVSQTPPVVAPPITPLIQLVPLIDIYVSSEPAGSCVTDPSLGWHTVNAGSTFSVTVTSVAPGYEFNRWDMILNGVRTTVSVNPSVSFTVPVTDQSMSLIAVSVSTPPPEEPPPSEDTRTITITSGAGGTTDPAPGTYTYNKNTIFNASAIPDSSHDFKTFIYDGYDVPLNPLPVTMDINHTLQAVFTEKTAPPENGIPPGPSTDNQLKWATIITGVGIVGFLAYWLTSRK